jgi:hydroxypyruvate isomerase
LLRFDLNISILLREVPFLERFERAASLGFGAVEFWWPGDENLSAIVERVRASGLAVALINFDAGDLAGGERGFLNDSSRQEQFRTHVPIALEFAQQVGCSRLNAPVGNVIPGESREAQVDRVRQNLAWAADQAIAAHLNVVVEALNVFDTPRYLLTNTHETLQLLAEVDRPNLKYQYDIYHMQRMEGNLIATLHEHIGQIEHIQVADSPGRHEPGTGEIHYLNVLAALDALGYQGYVGLEYNPTTSSEASFAWLPGDRSGLLAVSDLRL